MHIKPILKKLISQYRQYKTVRQDKKVLTKINSMSDDIEKILEFEKLKSEQQAFVIINKTKSQAQVYKNGELKKTFNVGVGKTAGDDLNTVTYHNGEFSGTGATTPPGGFTTQVPYDKSLNILLLKGVQHPINYKDNVQLALHDIPPSKQERLSMLETNGRKSMSNGCINFKSEDFEQLKKEINPAGTSVYILPEEQENRLELISTPNGLWFKPKYKDKDKANIFEEAFRKFFKLNK